MQGVPNLWQLCRVGSGLGRRNFDTIWPIPVTPASALLFSHGFLPAHLFESTTNTPKCSYSFCSGSCWSCHDIVWSRKENLPLRWIYCVCMLWALGEKLYSEGDCNYTKRFGLSSLLNSKNVFFWTLTTFFPQMMMESSLLTQLQLQKAPLVLEFLYNNSEISFLVTLLQQRSI